MTQQQILEVTGHIAPQPRVHYLQHEFDVPQGATAVSVALRYHKQRVCQLFLSLFDPEGFRGCHMQPGARGDITLPLRVATNDASRGGIAGAIPAGCWRAQIDIERTVEETDYILTATAEFGDAPAVETPAYPDGYVSNAQPDWYRGELHAHSWESDGKVPVADVVAAARHYKLDFLALTDHFTTSGYRELGAHVGSDIALIRSMELTGHAGHANIHGLHRWHDIFVDGRADWTINDLAREVHEAGGLFCVNHPFAADLGWRYHEFDWRNADLIEVYHHLEGANNMYQIGLWDEQLRAGRHIVGVAGTDSHHPHDQRHRLGQVFTAVYADELSEQGIIDGLRRGCVYATRGPALVLEATNGERNAQMGATLPAGTVQLAVTLDAMEYPFRLFVLKNGFYFGLEEQRDIRTAPMQFHFADDAKGGDYYRVEVHAIFPNEENPWKQQRDWQSLVAFTNPVFVE